MSEEKIDETNRTQYTEANGDEENNSVSDGEIVDDDDLEEQKSAVFSFPHRKVNKNFRSREKSESDEVESKSGKKSP